MSHRRLQQANIDVLQQASKLSAHVNSFRGAATGNFYQEKNIPSLTMSAVAAFLSSSNLHVLLCLLGGICCFLPVMTGAPSLIEESILSRSLESGFYYRDTSVALLALAVPLAADIGIDFFILLINGKKAPSNDAICFQCSVCSFQKLTCLIGIVIVPITAYLPGQYSNHALIYVCCNKCRTLIVGSIVMITLSQYIKKYWPVKSTLLFLALLSFGQIGTAFAENTTGIDSNKKLSLCAKISTLLAAIILVVSSFRCLYEVIHKEYRLAKLEKQILPNATGSERHYWSRILFSLLNLLIFAIVVLLLSVNAAKYDAMRNYTDEALLQSNVAYLIFELAFTIMTMRMIKFDVVRGLVSHRPRQLFSASRFPSISRNF